MNVITDYSTPSSHLLNDSDTSEETTSSESSTSSGDSTKTGRTSYLSDLRKRFDKLKISLGDYSGGEAGRGTGNVKLSAKYLAKAQQDPEVAAELENCLSGIFKAESEFISQCNSEGIQVNSSGVIIDESGCIYSWANVTAYLRPGSEENSSDEGKKKEEETSQQDADSPEARFRSTFANFQGVFESISSSVQIPITFTVFA